MPYYAAVVIVRADDADEAHYTIASQIGPFGGDTVEQFVGTPWEVTPVNEHHRYERIEEYVNPEGRLKLRAIQRKVPLDPEFDTSAAIHDRELTDREVSA